MSRLDSEGSEVYRRIFAVAIPATIACLAALVGCEGPEGPIGPSGAPYVYVEGDVSVYPEDSLGYAFVQVLNNPGIPSVEINGFRIPPVPDFQPHVFRGDFPILPSDAVHLYVAYPKLDGSLGIAQASVILPGLFQIVHPDTSCDTISISLGDSLTVRWESARGAAIYSFSLSFQYEYVDTAGIHRSSSYYSAVTLLGDTSITFSQAELFPDLERIDSVESESGHFDVWAISGPVQEMQPGNVTGDGFGFFNGRTWGGSVTIRKNG